MFANCPLCYFGNSRSTTCCFDSSVSTKRSKRSSPSLPLTLRDNPPSFDENPVVGRSHIRVIFNFRVRLCPFREKGCNDSSSCFDAHCLNDLRRLPELAQKGLFLGRIRPREEWVGAPRRSSRNFSRYAVSISQSPRLAHYTQFDPHLCHITLQSRPLHVSLICLTVTVAPVRNF